MTRNVSIIATMRLPKQIDPKEVVVARHNEDVTALPQHEFDSLSVNHHDPIVPATVTWIVFFQVINYFMNMRTK